MKPLFKLQSCSVLALVALAGSAHAQLTIPRADGSNGPLDVTNDMTIDLGSSGTTMP